MKEIERPSTNEYGDYYQGYVDKVVPGNIFEILSDQMNETVSLIKKLNEESALYRYADDKWTVKEVIGHMIDSERVFTYRAMSFARGEQCDLPGFDQDAYVKAADFNKRSLGNLETEYTAIRESTLAFFSSLSDRKLQLVGRANGYNFTVRAMIYIIAGHERHHLDLLQSKYNLTLKKASPVS
jgi:uncharacterized damage-inducible protein DinB